MTVAKLIAHMSEAICKCGHHRDEHLEIGECMYEWDGAYCACMSFRPKNALITAPPAHPRAPGDTQVPPETGQNRPL